MRKDILKQIERIKTMNIKINYSSFAKQYNCDPRTVKNYFNDKTKEKRKTYKKESILENYKSIIEDKTDNCFATAISIFNFIKQKGYAGKYGLVKKYVRAHKKEQLKKATIRFETNPGFQGQVDFKEKMKLVNKNSEVFEFNIFLFILGYSRIKYMEITTDKSQKTVFNCLINAFKAINGVPEEILFDNMATVIDRHNTYTGNVDFNKKFIQFAKDFNFTPVACKPYRPQTKGKVESLAKLTNRLNVYNNEFENLEELRKIVLEVNTELNNEISQAVNVSPNSRLEAEQKNLTKLPDKIIINSYFERNKEYKVSKESMITYLGKKYSVPISYIGKSVEIEIRPENNQLEIYKNNDLVVVHNISDKLFNYKKEHAIDILKSDAFKYKSINEIEDEIKRNLNNLDVFLDMGVVNE